MFKVMITGFNGFVGYHFVNYLEANCIESYILGLDISESKDRYSSFKYISVKTINLNMLDQVALERIVADFKPEYVLHLASFSSVSFSWKNPVLSFNNNMNIFLNLVESIRKISFPCRLLSIGSSEEYGNMGKELMPLREDYSLAPTSPYAVARVSQEMCSKVYCDGYDLDIVLTRSFNHIGPEQKDVFVISSFAKQLVEIKKGIRKDKCLFTGNVDIVRDFVDVRDVVRAYYLLLLKGQRGEIYNICSGEGVSLREIIGIFMEILDIDIQIVQDETLLRPNENMIIIGSNEKIKKNIGWERQIPLRKSLEDVIHYWEGILS